MHTDATVKKKFESPTVSKKIFKSGISPKFKANLKDFGKGFKARGELGTKHGAVAKRKLSQKSGKSLLPVRYHLGGNSSDPLNLNELIDRDPSITVTPQCSPAVSLVERDPDEVFQPVQLDAKDPLHLENASPFHNEDMLKMKKKKKRKRNNSFHEQDEKDQENIETDAVDHNAKSPKVKHRKSSSEKEVKKEVTREKIDCINEVKGSVEKKSPCGSDSESKINKKKKSEKYAEKSELGEKKVHESEMPENSNTEIENENKSEEIESKNELSPKNNTLIVEGESTEEQKEITPAKTKKRQKSNDGPSAKTKHPQSNEHKFRDGDKKFIYGNYNRYYGYRNPDKEDTRLQVFRQEWFYKKDVLDIGCNTGHITLTIARDFNPRQILGSDIDGRLIGIARKNVRHYVGSQEMSTSAFPLSFSLSYGPLLGPVIPKKSQAESTGKFPHNIIFKQENFVPTDDKQLETQKPMYDTILCLSVTKWIQLNWGDEGLKRMFKKIFLSLRPGGSFILEIQPFSSYTRKRNLTETIRQNYDKIHLVPEQFTDFLLSPEVGFASYEILDIPLNKSKGFQRPMFMFTKASESQKQHHELLGDWY